MTKKVRVYNWSDIPAFSIRRGLTSRAFSTQKVMVVMSETRPGMEVRPHTHEDFEQVVIFLRGRGIYHVGDSVFEVGPGAVLSVPAGVQHYFEPIGDETAQAMDIFVPPREDYQHLVGYLKED